jgi:RHO1 GDP-GTP exchange protein 1/2
MSIAGYAFSYTSSPSAESDFCYQPIPLDLLTLANFTDPTTQRGTGLLRGFGGGGNKGDAQTYTPGVAPDAASATDSRAVYPCTILHTGRLGGLYTVYADSSQARSEWKEKLDEAIGLRKVVQESNKVFEVETLSLDTFIVPSMLGPPTNQSWNAESSFTGKVTCSVPFSKQILLGNTEVCYGF